MKPLLLIAVLFTLPAVAAPKWLRRASMAAVCVASAADAFTTHRVALAGGTEQNPLMRGPQGRPHMGRVIGIKVAMCGGMAVLQEWRGDRHNALLTTTNFAHAAVFAGVAYRNAALERKLLGNR